MIFGLYLFLPPWMDSLVQKGLYASYNGEYEKAKRYYEEIIKKAPELPAGYFFKGAVYEVYMIDFGTDCFEDSFYLFMKMTKENAEKMLKKNKKDKTALFFMGACYAFTTIYEGWHKRYFKALHYGLKAKWYFDKLLSLDSHFYDAYLLRGAYEYFAGRVNKYLLGILPFGNINKGIELLKKTAEKARYLNVTAKQALAWVLTEEKRYCEAKRFSKELINKYPRGRIFLWQYGKILLLEGKYDSAEKFWSKFCENIKNSKRDSYNNIAEASYYLAVSFYKNGKKEKALEILNQILKNRKKIRTDIGYMNVLEKAENLRKEIEKK